MPDINKINAFSSIKSTMNERNQARKSTLGNSAETAKAADIAKKNHTTQSTTKKPSPLQMRKKDLQMHKKESRPKTPAQLVDIQA